jgi:RNA recognition motif-containing protein
MSTDHYTNIFIRDLPSTMTLQEFKELFRKFGPINDCKLLYHPRTRRFEGDALVLYKEPYSARDAIAEMNDRIMENRKVRVQYADRQPEKPKTTDNKTQSEVNRQQRRESPTRRDREDSKEHQEPRIRERSRSPPNLAKRRLERARDRQDDTKKIKLLEQGSVNNPQIEELALGQQNQKNQQASSQSATDLQNQQLLMSLLFGGAPNPQNGTEGAQQQSATDNSNAYDPYSPSA